MIGKVPKPGRGFRGLIDYLLDGPKDRPADAKRVAWTETHNLISDNPDHASALMRLTARKSRRVKSPVYHLVISWHPREAPSDDLMRQVANTTCEDLGLSEYQRLVIAHHDTEHRHVHIVVNRVHPETGRAWNRRKDWVHVEQSLRRQAEENGLEFVPGRHNSKERYRDRTRRARDGSYRQARKEGRGEARPSWSRERVAQERQRLAPQFETARSWLDLEARLAQSHMTLERKGQGLVIVDATGEMKLSSLGKQVRLSALEERYGEAFATHAPERARKPLHEPPPPEKTQAYEALEEAHATTDLAYALYRMGLISKRQLQHSLRDQQYAQSQVDEHRSAIEKIQSEVRKAFSSKAREDAPPQPDKLASPKTRDRRRKRDRDR
ncbi:MAG: relaxase/mobilization nuclease domain-containing protein [Nitrospiraceae bacterium]